MINTSIYIYNYITNYCDHLILPRVHNTYTEESILLSNKVAKRLKLFRIRTFFCGYLMVAKVS